MKRYKNIIYKNLSEYEEIKGKLKKISSLEIDFNNFKKLSDFDEFLSDKIDAPEHYFGGLDRLSDLLLDFHSFDNPEKIIFMIKNYESLKQIDKIYYKHLLAILDTAVDYLNKSEEATLRVYIFLNDNQLRKINRRKLEKTFVAYQGPKMKNKKIFRELIIKENFKKAAILFGDVEIKEFGGVLISMASEKQIIQPLKFVENLIKNEKDSKRKAAYYHLASSIQFDALPNFPNASKKGMSYLKKAIRLDPRNKEYNDDLKFRLKMIKEFGSP